ncbi:MAG: DUF167 domain-containing protein [Pseudomonadota bacterium]
MDIPHKKTGEGIVIEVRVTPRSSKNRISGLQGSALKVHLTAPPAEGQANKQLIKLLSKHFGIPKSAVQIVMGASSRSKLVLLKGIDTL